jgi:hypothetical protein
MMDVPPGPPSRTPYRGSDVVMSHSCRGIARSLGLEVDPDQGGRTGSPIVYALPAGMEGVQSLTN